ncbi:MAG TPA: DNA polymerase/3'-5' exonuclease PolX [Candidatus Methylomirabilis sp.]|nr:DNA polymerase/3'-5' exonuclease PolX [Candidatus Methylomirabilis sp.]
MKNFEVARQFDLMADVLELKGENPFRVRAYRRAAQNLQSLTEDVESVAREGRLEELPGVGADLAGKIQEYLQSGRIKEVVAATKGIPSGVVELMNVPGIGPRTAKLLYEREGITGIDELDQRARAGGLRGLPGIQAKTEQNILKGIRLVRGGQERMPLGRALPLGREIVHALERVAAVKRISLAGSIRRMKDSVGDIDILVTSSKPESVMRAFVALPQVADVLERGSTKGSIRHREGIQVDLRIVEPGCFGAALVYFTGSKQHNIRIREMGVKKGLKISEYGVFNVASDRRVAGATEEDVYAAVGVPWIAPELREDTGEIEAAIRRKLPRLVELNEIRGDLHCHTNATDGHHTIEALVAAAERRGYEYVAVTDHSRSTRVAGGLTAQELAAHIEKVHAVQAKHPRIRVLAGSECDILADGSLDYPDPVLAGLDLVVAAVHTGFKQSRSQMTRRICRALAHPRVHVLAHPTGRLIGERDPYALDLDEVLRTARRHGKAIEINAYPDRLDLKDVHARRAQELGALVAISTDTHMLDHLGYMELGVATARRGWTDRTQVVNTWPLATLLAWTGAERSARARKAHG